MEYEDKQLDDLLRMRSVPEPRSNLEYRILQASLIDKNGVNVGFGSVGLVGVIVKGLRAALDCVVIPHPAFAMVLVLLGGAMLGLYSGSGVSYSGGYSVSDVESFVMSADDFEYGDYL